MVLQRSNRKKSNRNHSDCCDDDNAYDNNEEVMATATTDHDLKKERSAISNIIPLKLLFLSKTVRVGRIAGITILLIMLGVLMVPKSYSSIGSMFQQQHQQRRSKNRKKTTSTTTTTRSTTTPYNQDDPETLARLIAEDALQVSVPLENVIVKSTIRTKFTPIPNNNNVDYHHTVNVAGKGSHTALMPIFQKAGWKLCKMKEALIVYRAKLKDQKVYKNSLQPWQRFSRLPSSAYFNDKDSLLQGMQRWHQRSPTTNPMWFLPETYLLTTNNNNNNGPHWGHHQQEQFQHRLQYGGGRNQTWVLKNARVDNGKGITMLPAFSKELDNVIDFVQQQERNHNNNNSNTSMVDTTTDPTKITKTQQPASTQKTTTSSTTTSTTTSTSTSTSTSNTKPQYVIQAYIPHILKWFHGEKFDLRFFWFVASMDPLIVFYHDGYARINTKTAYNETDFSDPGSHLTNHGYRGTSSGNFSKEFLWQRVQEHYDDAMTYNKNTVHTNNKNGFPKIQLPKSANGDPIQHVRNQMKEALGSVVSAFRDTAFGRGRYKPITRENAFALYGVDFILDQDLDVYLIETQSSPGFGNSPTYQIIFQDVYSPILNIVEEIAMKQIQNPKANILPLNTPLGGWELVYAGDWRFVYLGYQRNPQKTGPTTTSY